MVEHAIFLFTGLPGIGDHFMCYMYHWQMIGCYHETWMMLI